MGITEIKGIVIRKVTEKLLAQIKERSEMVLSERFGLKSEKPKVLDEIGRNLGITRERVRQIENDGFGQLRKAEKDKDFEDIIERALVAIDISGDFCEKRRLKEQIMDNPLKMDRNRLMLILNSSDKLKFHREKLDISGFWTTKENKVLAKEVVSVHKFIVDYLKEIRETLVFSNILDYLRTSSQAKFFEGTRGEKRLEMILTMSRRIDCNILSQWGLKNWRLISGRGSREKSYLVLKNSQKPLHFKEITDLINEHWKNKKALSQTVHNELIKDERFVLVGRGIYGLSEWGFIPGTVKDLIIDFFKKNNLEPIKKMDIVEYVLSKKRVKATTILVALSDKNKFEREKDNVFRLKEE